MPIKISESSIIYIACPGNFATGGTELLHQLCYKLTLQGFNAKIYYYEQTESDPVHPNFKVYGVSYDLTVVDSQDHIIIIPEIKTDLAFKFSHIRKVIWWLSVDNYYTQGLKPNILKLLGRIPPKNKYYSIRKFCRKAHIAHHLVQSEYALNFLAKLGISSLRLSDYLNSTFIAEAQNIDYSAKEDLVLYNPKKGFKQTRALIKSAPQLRWIALENLSVKQVADLLRRAKVYIDFGNHPGKDRFPREAAIMGCVVITGKKGSAANDTDIPIPSDFKFADFNKQSIIAKITEALQNYHDIIPSFETYRAKIRGEEFEFERAITHIFEKSTHERMK